QGFDISFRTQAAAKLHQRFAIVVAMTIKCLVDPALNTSLERVKDCCRSEDGQKQGPFADRFREPLMHDFGGECNHAKVVVQEHPGCEGIGHTTLEDEVSIHQAVADNGPTE